MQLIKSVLIYSLYDCISLYILCSIAKSPPSFVICVHEYSLSWFRATELRRLSQRPGEKGFLTMNAMQLQIMFLFQFQLHVHLL